MRRSPSPKAQQSLVKLRNRAAAVAAVCAVLLVALLKRGSGWGGGGPSHAQEDEEERGSGGAAFSITSSGGGGTRRPLERHQMCGWGTAIESSSFDRAVDKDGYPTAYEKLVEEGHPLQRVFCPVCGKAHQTMHFSGFNLREEGRCSRCASFNRLRQIADVALSEVWRMTGSSLRNLAELAGTDLDIYNTQCAGVLHDLLSSASGYVCSEFVSTGLEPGAVVKGVRHEDLQRLSFPDRTFDIVFSGEMMSRVANPYQAHYEILRVLKPGGSHVFSAPFMPTRFHDEIRASVQDGRLVHHVQPPIYTGDRLHPKGLLLFTIFGKEMVDKMCMLGYNVTAHHLHNGAHGIIGDSAWVFVGSRQ